MENNGTKFSMFHLSMYYGLFLGLFLILRFFLSAFSPSSMTFSFLVLFATCLIPILAYFFARKFRDNFFEENVRYAHIYMFCFLLFFFASLFLAAVEYIFYQYIQPDFLNQQYSLLLNEMKLLEKQIPELSTYAAEITKVGVPSAIEVAIQNIWIYSFFGMVIGFILGFFLKRNTKKTL